MKQPVFTGCATAIITPFDENGSIDFDSLGVLIDRQIAGRADAIVTCGTTGECATLSDLEYDQVISFCAGRINGRVPLIAGAGSNATAHAQSLARSAARLGADALLVVTPYYNKSTPSGLIAHFTAVAEAGRLPMLLYNVPSRTGVSITADVYRALSENPYIYGTKEASGDMALVLEARRTCPEDFQIYSGNDDQILPMLALGGSGVISTVANLVPRAVHDLCSAWLEGDRDEALRLQLALQPLIQALFAEVNPIPLKAALELMGYDSGQLRLPLVRLSGHHRNALKAAMSEFGLI